MALDGLFLSFVRHELESELTNARIDKIHQPSKEDILIHFRTREGTKRLILSAAANSPRAHLTSDIPENPKSPPPFCTVLRKHISNGRLLEVTQPDGERILSFHIEAVDEIGDLQQYTLTCEMMGRHSNIILVRDGKVVDAVKRVTPEMSTVRPILPGAAYTLPPPQQKKSLTEAPFEEIWESLTALPELPLDKALLKTIQGMSPVLCRETAEYVLRNGAATQRDLDENGQERLKFYLSNVKERVESGDAQYTAMVSTENNKPVEFSFLPLRQYGTACVSKEFDSAGALLDFFYRERGRVDRMRQRSHDLLKLLVQTTDRVSRRMAAQTEELLATEDRSTYRLYGELIQAQPYALHKGQTEAELVNFYDGSTIKIPLRAQDTPIQNAQWYFKQYRKACAAREKLTEQIEEAKRELEYLDSVFDALVRTDGESELLEIREELSEQGYLKHYKKPNKMLKPRPPISYRSSDGFLILCGRNNKQNDKLTLRQARGSDIWLHVQKAAGAHVIVVAEGKDVPDTTLTEAAELAAYHSKSRESAQVPVDYTQVRNVKKPAGAKPGMVIFDNYHTAYVTPKQPVEPVE